jgi:hypothetical protein
MSTNTETNITSILAKWADGNGNPINPPNSKHLPIGRVLDVDYTEYTINGVTITPTIALTRVALEVWKNSSYGQEPSKIADELALLHDGYVSSAHKTKALASSSEAKVKAPFENQKSVITAQAYWNNCIKMGLSPDNADKVSELVTAFYSLNDKATKADLTSLLAELIHLFMSPEQHVIHGVKLEDERIAAAKFAALTDAGFVDIRTMAEGRYVANLATSSLGSVSILTPNNFVPIGMQPINPELYQITFKDLVSVQV